MSCAGGVVVFDPAAWIAAFPELTATPQQAAQWFNQATLYCANTPDSPVPAVERATLLDLLTAHIGKLFQVKQDGSGQLESSLVGRIESATQGSVSVSAGAIVGTPGWFQQTQYGVMYWQATAIYRTFRYRRARAIGYPSSQTLFGITPGLRGS